MESRDRRIEFGDFQTPDALAASICARLVDADVRPDVVLEPTCGVGAFVMAAAAAFPRARIVGFELNEAYLQTLRKRLDTGGPVPSTRIELEAADFFSTDWQAKMVGLPGALLIIGNLPWVTNAVQGSMGGTNLPAKSNFLGHTGFEAISGKANFDISEWMLLELIRSCRRREVTIAMLVKTAVARKVLAHAQRQQVAVREAFLVAIDAKKAFDASVEACLMVLRLGCSPNRACHDYTVFDHLDAPLGTRVGHRDGMTVRDLDTFRQNRHLLGTSPQKWRSGIKHDSSAVMELTQTAQGFVNGSGEVVQLEPDYLFPLLKGSDIGSDKAWRRKFVLVTQRAVGQSTNPIKHIAPLTWAYLESHAAPLDARASSIYAKNPRYSVFGVGSYAFRPWRIAICGLYKRLQFRLVGPIEGKAVMFDDTVYYVSFDTCEEGAAVLAILNRDDARALLDALVFWDEKRPIKTSVLNALDWRKGNPTDTAVQASLL